MFNSETTSFQHFSPRIPNLKIFWTSNFGKWGQNRPQNLVHEKGQTNRHTDTQTHKRTSQLYERIGQGPILWKLSQTKTINRFLSVVFRIVFFCATFFWLSIFGGGWGETVDNIQRFQHFFFIIKKSLRTVWELILLLDAGFLKCDVTILNLPLLSHNGDCLECRKEQVLSLFFYLFILPHIELLVK